MLIDLCQSVDNELKIELRRSKKKKKGGPNFGYVMEHLLA
jgi:hypothetical protein